VALGERRIEALRDLGVSAPEGKTAEEACRQAALALRNHDKDIPFTLIYLLDVNDETARLVATSGFENGERPTFDEDTIGISKRAGVTWPLAEVIETKGPILVENLVAVMSKVPRRPVVRLPEYGAHRSNQIQCSPAGHRLSGGGHQSASAP
jgi:hypothetical protein